MAHPDLDRLIIRNLADLDAAWQYLDTEIEPAVWDVINQHLKVFREKTGWEGKDEWPDKAWFAPSDWRKQGEYTGDDFRCQFTPGEGIATTGTDGSYLTQLLGIGHQRLGLWWIQKNVVKGRRRILISQQPTIVSNLRKHGFVYEDSEAGFFLPVLVDQSALADALADESPEMAFEPFVDALQVCLAAKPDFDALLAAAASTNGTKKLSGKSPKG